MAWVLFIGGVAVFTYSAITGFAAMKIDHTERRRYFMRLGKPSSQRYYTSKASLPGISRAGMTLGTVLVWAGLLWR